jgi:hypothetical protein
MSMPLLEDAKRSIERVTGLGRPARKDLALLIQSRKPHLLRFKDDGETPNNARCPMIPLPLARETGARF